MQGAKAVLVVNLVLQTLMVHKLFMVEPHIMVKVVVVEAVVLVLGLHRVAMVIFVKEPMVEYVLYGVQVEVFHLMPSKGKK